MSFFSSFTYWLSAEWLLNGFRPNGGDTIVARSLVITVWATILAVLLQAWIDPTRTVRSWLAFREQVLALAPWSGAVFAGAYLALYARFSSQWGYLANLYNQIKEVEAGEVKNPAAMASWKAGFIEDAQNLHLACKESIAPILHAWSADPEVEKAFVKYVPGGKKRLDALKLMVAKAYRKAESRYR